MDLMNVGFVGALGGGASIETTGAVFSQSGGYDYYKWTGNGTVTIKGFTDVEVLIVGQGASGRATGGYNHGGGGSGGVVFLSAHEPDCNSIWN